MGGSRNAYRYPESEPMKRVPLDTAGCAMMQLPVSYVHRNDPSVAFNA